MLQYFKFSVSGLATLAALAFAAPPSMANGQPDVSWSLSVGSGRPAPVYAPPVVYTQPQPIYVHPAPVYVQPAPVVQYGAPYYVEEVRYKKFGHRHWGHHHH